MIWVFHRVKPWAKSDGHAFMVSVDSGKVPKIFMNNSSCVRFQVAVIENLMHYIEMKTI